MTGKRLVGVVAALVVSAAVLSACGGSTALGSGGPGDSAAAAGDVQATAKTKVAEYEKGPSTYPGPTEAFDPGTGKAEVLACGFGAPVCASQSQVAVTALKTMGWDAPPPVDGQFSPQVEAAFLDRAVANKLDGVVLVAVNVNTIKASVERAAAAGLTIMCTQCVSGPQWQGKVYDVTVDFAEQGEIAAWQVLANAGPKARIAAFDDPQFASAVLRQQSFKKTIESNCPDCEFTLTHFAAADLSKPGPPSFTALLASHPKGTLDYVIGHYDGLGVQMSNTAKNAGRLDFKIGSYDGSPDGIASLAGDNPPNDFDVADPFTYEEWAAADLMARIKVGAPSWTGYDAMPSTLITQNNVKEYVNKKPDVFPAPEGYEENFKKLWGSA
ncbi:MULTISPECIES: sugar ABC transporter substrate-binding protein [unclassified Pseudofrankia]|uniref:sugar ABC transporter substrate-binding protein n=1 Tax=unclassified Pseudofrankia TaxID=2994372 RepID=UPI0008D97755|nr:MULTISPECIES: sugar ABC transporter substrate-binding protein [unclassified Pseudofrankia]MDT3444672.1 sugar ABC transporter substrate-binding protein [Pseudofrankia sp. BMG5.37]OHV66586.1 hypothetical protein BCD48_35900 [Pseudofrankia sp. BMG5.36]